MCKGPEFDELRKRGFRIYEKTAGMFLVYKAGVRECGLHILTPKPEPES